MQQCVVPGKSAQAAVEVEVGLDPPFEILINPGFAHGLEETAQLCECFGAVSPLGQRSCGHGLEGRPYGEDVTNLFRA